MDEKSLMVKPTATVSQKIVDNTGAYIQGGSGKGGTPPPLPTDFEGQLPPPSRILKEKGGKRKR